MVDLIVILVLAAVVGGAAAYIIRAKTRGVKCIGCPGGASCGRGEAVCPGNCAGCSGSCAHKHAGA
ncbi:MAG: FeoB-associated Cys-rich membrane protein [Clostridia bacterium]|nr:FeoB-associated Cys-rich membrane protein [Clostridia bacterium]